MTPDEIQEAVRAAQEAKARADKASDDPWEAEENNCIVNSASGCLVGYCGGASDNGLREDALFIASARTDVPTLADAVIKLAGEVERLRDKAATQEIEAARLSGLMLSHAAEHTDSLLAERAKVAKLEAEVLRIRTGCLDLAKQWDEADHVDSWAPLSDHQERNHGIEEGKEQCASDLRYLLNEGTK